jgi:hypothetical protein
MDHNASDKNSDSDPGSDDIVPPPPDFSFGKRQRDGIRHANGVFDTIHSALGTRT